MVVPGFLRTRILTPDFLIRTETNDAGQGASSFCMDHIFCLDRILYNRSVSTESGVAVNAGLQ